MTLIKCISKYKIHKTWFHSQSILKSSSSFDTYKFVQKLEGNGYSRETSEAVMNSLGEVLNTSIFNISKTSVSKADYEKQIYVQRVDFDHLRSEMNLLEKNEVSLIKQEMNRITRELEKLNLQMGEDLRRASSHVRLELSIEKGRIRDEQTAQELRIKDADSKIDTEVSQVKTILETIQWELFKTLFPLFCAAGALFFSYLRFIA